MSAMGYRSWVDKDADNENLRRSVPGGTVGVRMGSTFMPCLRRRAERAMVLAEFPIISGWI